jgi:DNA-binding protein HU-1
MTKSNIIDELAKRTGIKKKDAELAVDTVFDIIEESLASGEKVQISGFGTFELRERGSRNGRNPFTGEPMVIGPTRHVSFNIGKTLKERIK